MSALERYTLKEFRHCKLNKDLNIAEKDKR